MISWLSFGVKSVCLCRIEFNNGDDGDDIKQLQV